MICISLPTVSALVISSVLALPVGNDDGIIVHRANSMWIEPFDTSPLDLRIAPGGTEFNFTVWLNITTPTNSWRFYLTYPPDFLNATRCGYTSDGKSLWAGDRPIFPVAPQFGVYEGYGYVMQGENLKSNGTRTGAGSLSWVEFNLTHSADHSLFGQLRLDILGVFKSFALDKDLKEIPLTFGLVNITPEFQLPSLLVAFIAATSCVTTVFRRLGKKTHA